MAPSKTILLGLLHGELRSLDEVGEVGLVEREVGADAFRCGTIDRDVLVQRGKEHVEQRNAVLVPALACPRSPADGARQRTVPCSEQRPDQRRQLLGLLLAVDQRGDLGGFVTQSVQLTLAAVGKQTLELHLELCPAQGSFHARPRARLTHVVQEPTRPGAQIERFAHERRVSRDRSRAATAVQDEARQPNDPAGVRAEEDRALLTSWSRLEGCPVDDHSPGKDARGDGPGSATRHVLERIVEVLRVEPAGDLANAAFAQQRTHRAGRRGRAEEDLLLAGERKTGSSGHRGRSI